MQIEMPGPRGVPVPQVLELIGQDDRFLVSGQAVALVDQVGQFSSCSCTRLTSEKGISGQDFQHQNPPHRGIHQSAWVEAMRTLIAAWRSTSPAS